MRSDIKNIVSKLSATHPIPWDFDVLECYNIILNYCKETKTQPRRNEYSVENGVLIINGIRLERVAVYMPYRPRVKRCNIVYDYEGAILLRQELDNC